MADDVFTADDLAKADEYDGLGPAYFAARHVCEGAMEAFQAEHMEPLLKDASDKFYKKLLDAVQEHLWSNAEMNLQSRMYQMVDRTVHALLGGEDWAIKRYVFGRYDCVATRAAVAKLIPKELQDARIADLEAELGKLRSDLEWHRAQ